MLFVFGQQRNDGDGDVEIFYGEYGGIISADSLEMAREIIEENCSDWRSDNPYDYFVEPLIQLSNNSFGIIAKFHGCA